MGNLVTKDRKTVKMVCPCDPGELGATMHTAARCCPHRREKYKKSSLQQILILG